MEKGRDGRDSVSILLVSGFHLIRNTEEKDSEELLPPMQMTPSGTVIETP